MKKLKVLSTLSILSFLLVGCGGNGNVTSSLSSEDEITSIDNSSDNVTSEENNTSEIGSINPVEDYDSFADTYSKPNHLYIHYYKEDAKTFADYAEYGLWLWEPGKAGVLFAAGTNPGNLHVSTNSWMKDIGGRGAVDEAGVCADIDLSSTDYVTGETGKAIDGSEQV